MSGLSQEARALIEGTAELDEPSTSDKSRIQQRLMLQLGAAAFATSIAAAGSGAASVGGMTRAAAAKGLGSIAPKGAWLGGLGKALLGAAALGGIGMAWWAATPTPTPDTTAAARPLAPALAPAVASDAPAPIADAPLRAEPRQAPAPATPALTARPASKAARAKVSLAEPKPVMPGGDTLKAELALLGRAQAALRAGRFQEALTLTGEHSSQFPEGVMKEERMGVAALAACGLSPERRQEAEVFLKQAASSPLAARVKKACNLP